MRFSMNIGNCSVRVFFSDVFFPLRRWLISQTLSPIARFLHRVLAFLSLLPVCSSIINHVADLFNSNLNRSYPFPFFHLWKQATSVDGIVDLLVAFGVIWFHSIRFPFIWPESTGTRRLRNDCRCRPAVCRPVSWLADWLTDRLLGFLVDWVT